jgi:hypothetical protein
VAVVVPVVFFVVVSAVVFVVAVGADADACAFFFFLVVDPHAVASPPTVSSLFRCICVYLIFSSAVRPSTPGFVSFGGVTGGGGEVFFLFFSGASGWGGGRVGKRVTFQTKRR